MVISTFMSPKTEEQIITVHILPNISISTVNQTMKLGRVIVHNISKKPQKNHTQNVVEIIVSDPKNQNRAYLWIKRLNIYRVCFSNMSKLRTTKIY